MPFVEEKVAIVTGAGSGIGKGAAIALAKAGAKVVLAGRREALIGEVKAEIEAMGKEAIGVKTDVSKWTDAQQLAKAAMDNYGQIDILVNNAAVHQAGEDGHRLTIMELEEADWDMVLNINLKGMFLCTKAVLPSMMSQRAGKIVNLGSTTALNGNISAVHYIASKGGIMSLTKGLAREVGQYNITVNCVAPGLVITPMHDHTPPETIERAKQMISLGRPGYPEDVARLIVFLASDNTFTTGQTIVVDGGSTMH